MLAITCRSTYALERFGSSSGGSASSPTSSVPGGVLDCVPPPPPPPHAAATDNTTARNTTAPARIIFIFPPASSIAQILWVPFPCTQSSSHPNQGQLFFRIGRPRGKSTPRGGDGIGPAASARALPAGDPPPPGQRRRRGSDA